MTGNNLSIRDYNVYRTATRLKKSISDSTHTLREISFLILRIKLENGIIGESYLLTFQYSSHAILGALKDAKPLIVGSKVFNSGLLYDKLDSYHEYFGVKGLLNWVKGLASIAMWDAWGKYLNQPIWKLLGKCQTKVPIYGSGGWLSYSIDELIEEVIGYAERGFKAVKIKVGSPDWKIDMERLLQVRKAIGDDVDILMDANQGFDLSSAIALTRAVMNLNIYCFEEPINHLNFDGYKKLRNETSISLAMGEREFDTVPLRELLTRNALDLWQPDILRIGGVDAWRKSAALAAGFHTSVLPHYYKDYDVPLLCTVPNGVGAESFDWINPLINNPIRVKNGYAYPHDEPGWGFSFIDDHLTQLI